MCLAVPALIKAIENKEAIVELGGVQRRVSIWLTPEAQVGDYVLVHTGYAINVIDAQEAKETLRLLQELAESYNEEELFLSSEDALPEMPSDLQPAPGLAVDLRPLASILTPEAEHEQGAGRGR